MNAHRFWFAFGAQFAACVLEVADQFLFASSLFGVGSDSQSRG
jgi:hypothetical protein